MIYSNLNHITDYSFLSAKIAKCFDYAKTHDLANMTPGRHDIDGDDLYVNIAAYTTSSEDVRIWEAHKRYLDLHLMLAGEECIALNHIQNMELGEFQEARDFLPMQGPAQCLLTLRPGDFLICYPGDGHKTGICVAQPSTIRKAIFKIRID